MYWLICFYFLRHLLNGKREIESREKRESTVQYEVILFSCMRWVFLFYFFICSICCFGVHGNVYGTQSWLLMVSYMVRIFMHNIFLNFNVMHKWGDLKTISFHICRRLYHTFVCWLKWDLTMRCSCVLLGLLCFSDDMASTLHAPLCRV
jgi:hypothetical protein